MANLWSETEKNEDPCSTVVLKRGWGGLSAAVSAVLSVLHHQHQFSTFADLPTATTDHCFILRFSTVRVLTEKKSYFIEKQLKISSEILSEKLHHYCLAEHQKERYVLSTIYLPYTSIESCTHHIDTTFYRIIMSLFVANWINLDNERLKIVVIITALFFASIWAWVYVCVWVRVCDILNWLYKI